jgi:hypothetical protein
MTGHGRQTRPECDLYIPGHLVHLIQARRASEHPRTRGVLEEVSGQVIRVRFRDRVARYRSHDADTVLEDSNVGAKVNVCERYGLLWVPLGSRNVHCFCVADAEEPWRPCSVAPPVSSFDDLAERMVDRGGFSIPGALLPGIDETGSLN